MTEQERAAELADQIKRDCGIRVYDNGHPDDVEAVALLEKGLRLLAETPAASPEVRERVAREIYAAFPFDEATGTKPAWVERGNSIRQDDARRCAKRILDLALSAIRPGDRLPAWGVVPGEVPAPKWLDRVAEEISEYQGLQAGWDGEDAETPSAHSVNEAVEFIRSLERGDIEPALHADGTVIILIGHTTLRFTNEGMSFVTRAAIAAAKEPTR